MNELTPYDITNLRQLGIAKTTFDHPSVTLDAIQESSYSKLSTMGLVDSSTINISQWKARVIAGMEAPGIDKELSKILLDLTLAMVGSREEIHQFLINNRGLWFLQEMGELLTEEQISSAWDKLLVILNSL